MSWLKQLANKAEAALESIDSGTASILKKEKVKYHTSRKSTLEHKRSSSYNLPSSEKLSTANSESRSWSFSAQNSLNSSPKDLKSRKRNTDTFSHNSASQKTAHDKTPHSRPSSSSSSFGSSSTHGSERETPLYGLDIDTSVDSGHVGSFGDVQQTPFRSIASSTVSTDFSDGHIAQDVYNFTSAPISESEMLRKEVASLNQEMTQVLRRAKEAECDCEKITAELSAVREYQKRNDALMMESQLREASLRNELLAAGGNVPELNQFETRSTNERLLTDAAETESVASDDFLSLKQKYDEIQLKFQEQRVSGHKMKEQYSTRLSELEESKKSIGDELAICQQRFETEMQSCRAFSQQILDLKSELVDCRREFDDYKAKAGRILEAKQRLFDSLTQKEGAGTPFSPDSLCQQEVLQLKSERDFLQEELDRSGKLIQNLRIEVTESELLAQKDRDSNLGQLTIVEQDLSRRQDELFVAREHKTRAEQELRRIQEEMGTNKASLTKRVQERDVEIDKLQKQIAHKMSSSVGNSELENRIHSLTEALILKQNNIESLSNERQSLTMKCEKLQEQYADAQKSLNTDVKIYVEDYRNRQSSFMTESPFDGGVTRRVKKAYGSMDKFSVRLGTFLRRYPTARPFILLYMVLLHVWVMIVLFTYTPETHIDT